MRVRLVVSFDVRWFLDLLVVVVVAFEANIFSIYVYSVHNAMIVCIH